MSFKKVLVLVAGLLSPLALADVKIYPHSSAMITAIQVYENGQQLKGAKVKLTDQSGRSLGEGVTNKYGYTNIKLEHGSYLVNIHVKTPKGKKKTMAYMPQIQSDMK